MVCCALLKWLRRNSKKKNDDDDTIGYVPAQNHRSVPKIEDLGESIHLLLAYGNKRNEDITFKQIEPVDGGGASSETGGEPLLEVHKKRYSQSTAISRYLGKRFGIAGADPFEDLEIDQIVEAFNDFRIKLVAVQCEIDSEVRQIKLQKFRNEAPKYLDKLNAVIAANNGHLALGKLTWADFVVAGLWDILKLVLNIPNIDVKYPHISGMVRAVLSIPGVREAHDTISRTGS